MKEGRREDSEAYIDGWKDAWMENEWRLSMGIIMDV